MCCNKLKWNISQVGFQPLLTNTTAQQMSPSSGDPMLQPQWEMVSWVVQWSINILKTNTSQLKLMIVWSDYVMNRVSSPCDLLTPGCLAVTPVTNDARSGGNMRSIQRGHCGYSHVGWNWWSIQKSNSGNTTYVWSRGPGDIVMHCGYLR